MQAWKVCVQAALATLMMACESVPDLTFATGVDGAAPSPDDGGSPDSASSDANAADAALVGDASIVADASLVDDAGGGCEAGIVPPGALACCGAIACSGACGLGNCSKCEKMCASSQLCCGRGGGASCQAAGTVCP